jgi:quercetin dioxygenase-like cupin family protein
MSAFGSVSRLDIVPIWDGAIARAFQGRDVMVALVELDPDAVVAAHQHPNEQIGFVLRGSLRFTIGGESRLLEVGDTYVIPAGVLHDAAAGPEGAVAVDVFAPPRADWDRLTRQPSRPPIWP